MFENIDFTTSAGIAAAVAIIMQIVKTQLFNADWKSYGLIVFLTTAVVSIGTGWLGGVFVAHLTWQQALTNGISAALIAASGYELVKNVVNQFTPAKKPTAKHK